MAAALPVGLEPQVVAGETAVIVGAAPAAFSGIRALLGAVAVWGRHKPMAASAMPARVGSNGSEPVSAPAKWSDEHDCERARLERHHQGGPALAAHPPPASLPPSTGIVAPVRKEAS